MPQPGEPLKPQPSAEDSFLDLLVETIDGLDESARGQFLRQFFRTIAQIDLTETQSGEHWQQILQRRRELGDNSRQEGFAENRHGRCTRIVRFPICPYSDGI